MRGGICNTPVDLEAAALAREIAHDLGMDTPWQRGDARVIDDFGVMHGRRTFTGTRRVLSSPAAA